MWKGEIKLIARAGDGDVKQPALFFERVAGIERTSAWEHSVGEPDNEDGVKLQTFRLVNRRKIDRFFVGRLVRRSFCIDIADKRKLREKFVHVFELARKSRELIQILAAQLVVREIQFRVVVVNRFHDRHDHFRRRVRLTSGRNFIERMRELFPGLL